MKKIFTLAAMFAAVAMVACGEQQKKAENTEEAPAVECTDQCCGECAEEAECTEECCGECAEAEAEVAPEAEAAPEAEVAPEAAPEA